MTSARNTSRPKWQGPTAAWTGRLSTWPAPRAATFATLADWQPGSGYRLEYDEPFPGVDRIAEHLRFTGERLIEVARNASVDRVLKGAWGDEPYEFPEWVLLLHAAHHATEHRQQIATMLTNLGIEPPEPDPVAYWHSTRTGPARDVTAGE